MRDIKMLHIEPTDVCQAACPLCNRETDPDFNKSDQRHLKVEHIQKLYSEEEIKNLDKLLMCGVYGDPAAGKYTLDLCNYFRKINHNIVLGMNSNGALQTTFWWHSLGQILSRQQDYCVFSIDGLEDTNTTYRKNVSWPKLMANVKAYIAAGGNAHWDMLVYRHNQHQVDACEALARDMGFKWFRTKVSRRPMIDGLEAPINWQVATKTVGTIQCRAIKEASEYVDARGRKIPCCWLGKIKDPISDFDQIRATWNTNSPHKTCSKTCGTHDGVSMFEDQWKREIDLSV
jgi:sulfatase maturation enzyme AslB (radical SAM superfamily)